MNQLLNFAVLCRYVLNRNFLAGVVFMTNMSRFFIYLCLIPPFPSRSEVRLETKAFLLIFIVPICSPKIYI